MSQSLSKIFVHVVFHIKNGHVTIRLEDKQLLYAYMGKIIRESGSIPIIINGTENHVHILCVLSKNIALAKLVEDVKRHSSRWIKTIDPYYSKFSWQGGYGGFSVSPSIHDKTKKYIANQEVHHRKRTFKEELIELLDRYDVEYDLRYLFND